MGHGCGKAYIGGRATEAGGHAVYIWPVGILFLVNILPSTKWMHNYLLHALPVNRG